MTEDKGRRMFTATALVSILRSLFIFLALYLVLSWATLLLYDTSPFDLGERLGYFFLNAHAPLTIACFCLVHLTGLFREFLLNRDADAVEPPEHRRRIRHQFMLIELMGMIAFTAIATIGISMLARFMPVDTSDGSPSLRPSSTFEMDQMSLRPTVVVHTNDAGFRDDDWDERGKGEDFRILLVGDSIVFGSGITNQSDTLTPMVDKELAGLSSRGIGVFNLSLNGLNLHQQVELIDRHAGRIEPDLVVVVHNTENDLMPLLPYYVSPLVAVAFHLGMIEYVGALDAWMLGNRFSDNPVIMSGTKEDAKRLAGLCSQHGFDVLFVYLVMDCPPAYLVPAPDSDRLFMQTWLDTLGSDEGLTFPNDFHPNPRGVRMMARDLAPVLARIIDESDEWRNASAQDPITHRFVRSCLSQESQGTTGRLQ